MLRSYKIYTCTNGALGLHLSRAPWDPYPWVSSIQKDSSSFQAGLRIGDCLLELNGHDVLGMRIAEIAALLKNHWLNESSNYVTVVIWRNRSNNSNNGNNKNSNEYATDASCNNNNNNNNNNTNEDDDYDDDEDEENNAHNINQQSLQKFATCLQHIAQLLECPVCLEVIKPPGWQCCNGHVLCNNCRSRSEKCPVCRVPLGPRGRCLLSDKLFTLLADSFPCDGVRSNKNSPKDRRKCSTEFHNQPKMAIVQHQHQQQDKEKDEQQGAKKAKEYILASIRQRRRRKLSSCKSSQDDGVVTGHDDAAAVKPEHKQLSMQKQAMYDRNIVVVAAANIKNNDSSNRKSSPEDYNSEVATTGGNVNVKGAVATMATTFRYDELPRQTSTIQQHCNCITCTTCSKPDKVATTPTTTTTTTLNKCVLRIPSQGHGVTAADCNHDEKYENYQCPTGKLCCLQVNVMAQATCTTPPYPATTKQTVFRKTLKTEWEVLAHLTEDHHLPVNQYYAEYGQRIQVANVTQPHSISCLNLKGSEHDLNIEKFFIACIPLAFNATATFATKVAIFIYHVNTIATPTATAVSTSASTTTTSSTDEVSNFETIIENPLTGIKWFGRAHPLTVPWSHIHEKRYFLLYDRLQQNGAVTAAEAAHSGERDGTDAFVVVVKRKLEIKTNI